MKTRKRRKKAAKSLNWHQKLKNNLLGLGNWLKDGVVNCARKAWSMLVDIEFGLAWGGIAFGVLTLIGVLDPWHLLAWIAIFLGVRHLWDNHRFH